MTRRDRDPGSMSPEEAAEMWLADVADSCTEKTVRDYRKNTRRFLQWCANEQVEEIGELTGWDIELFKRDRRTDVGLHGDTIAPATLRSSMMTLKQFVEFLVRIDAVDPDLGDKVAHAVPRLSDEDRTSDEMLAQEDALAYIENYRNDQKWYGTPRHAILEVLWHVGCRVGGLRALDLGDYDPDNRTLEFVNRSETGTRLKRGDEGERLVFISPAVRGVLDTYVARERCEKRDEHGRKPLFCFQKGRPVVSTLRAKAYLATQPCVLRECPHDRDPAKCEYRERNHASKCPSSRSPHPIRTGSITWHRDSGVPRLKTAKRVNASVETIDSYYDKADKQQQLERRRDDTEHLDITETTNDE
jgi:site-specific recombinase XerD